jgi:hypothetical protein
MLTPMFLPIPVPMLMSMSIHIHSCPCSCPRRYLHIIAGHLVHYPWWTISEWAWYQKLSYWTVKTAQSDIMSGIKLNFLLIIISDIWIFEMLSWARQEWPCPHPCLCPYLCLCPFPCCFFHATWSWAFAWTLTFDIWHGHVQWTCTRSQKCCKKFWYQTIQKLCLSDIGIDYNVELRRIPSWDKRPWVRQNVLWYQT